MTKKPKNGKNDMALELPIRHDLYVPQRLVWTNWEGLLGPLECEKRARQNLDSSKKP